MAKIRVDVAFMISDGAEVSFTAPCDCTAIEGLIIYHPGGSKVFTFKDAHGNDLTGIGNLFESGAIVKALLDVKNGHAYLQNADTNSYLEAHIKNVNNPHGVTAAQMGATTRTLLWKNASRTSSFPEQDIALDLSGYDEVMIYFCLNTFTDTTPIQNKYMVVGRCPVGEIAIANFVWADDGVKYHRFAETSETGIHFHKAYKQGGVDNAGCIPYRIYGIKNHEGQSTVLYHLENGSSDGLTAIDTGVKLQDYDEYTVLFDYTPSKYTEHASFLSWGRTSAGWALEKKSYLWEIDFIGIAGSLDAHSAQSADDTVGRRYRVVVQKTADGVYRLFTNDLHPGGRDITENIGDVSVVPETDTLIIGARRGASGDLVNLCNLTVHQCTVQNIALNDSEIALFLEGESTF